MKASTMFRDLQFDAFAIDTNTKASEKAILDWLSGLHVAEKHKSLHAKHCSGTYQWLLDSGDFRNWCTSDTNSVLWANGIGE